MRTLKLFFWLAMFAVVACQNEVVTDNKLTHGVESEVYAVSSDSSVVPLEQALKQSYDYNTTYDPDSPIATQLSSLCCELGKSYLCDVVYTPSGSTSNATKAKRALENLGYRNVDKRLATLKRPSG